MLYPIEPRQPKNFENYVYWEDFLTNEEINKILSLPNWLNTETARIGGSSSDGFVNKEIRETQVTWMTRTPDTEAIWAKLSNVISEVNRTFFNFDLTGFYEPAQLGLYKSDTQGFYNWHTDCGKGDTSVPRKLSMVLMLDDPQSFKGGELQIKVFNDEPITLEQKKGRAWIFPSYVLHRVTPVTEGTRRSLVLWIGGPAFK